MKIDSDVINQYKERIKALVEQLDIIDLTITDENKIDESLISDDELETKLNELLYTFKRVYPNLDGDAKRLKLMGNIHFRDEKGKVKSKSYQIYRLQKKEREDIQTAYENADPMIKDSMIPWKVLQEKYKLIAELCYLIEQIKLYEKFIAIKEKKENVLNNEDFESKELEKFYIKKERKKKDFF
jgi:hypothetical protein